VRFSESRDGFVEKASGGVAGNEGRTTLSPGEHGLSGAQVELGKGLGFAVTTEAFALEGGPDDSGKDIRRGGRNGGFDRTEQPEAYNEDGGTIGHTKLGAFAILSQRNGDSRSDAACVPREWRTRSKAEDPDVLLVKI
jgi:hypothetical protein